MSETPDTRRSLLLRVSDPANGEAWNEFVALYRPILYRLARKRGLQDADAEDIAQRVLVTVSQKIAEWEPASAVGSFRAWLGVVARNAILNFLTRGQRELAKGGTSVWERLERPTSADEAENEWDEEYRRAVFRRAAQHVRDEFNDSTWSAFWFTSVDGLSIEEAAQRLCKSVGVIYAGRSRVMRRLREKIREFESDSSS